MATYTDDSGNVYTHDDDKLAFDQWVDSDPARSSAWVIAATKHQAWQAANPSAHPADANDDANAMFLEWRAYANARRTAPV